MTKSAKATTKSTKSAVTVDQLIERYLQQCAKEYSAAYVKSLQGPLAMFAAWCSHTFRKDDVAFSLIDTKVLARYRAHAESQGHALSTTRMSLARVSTFLRSTGADLDLSVLRIQHTKKEKQHLAELAAARVEEVA